MKNMFGGNGCILESGRLCSLCCTALGASISQDYYKKPGIRCELLGENGCPLHNTEEQSQTCRNYFCGTDLRIERRVRILNENLRQNVLSHNEVEAGIRNIHPERY